MAVHSWVAVHSDGHDHIEHRADNVSMEVRSSAGFAYYSVRFGGDASRALEVVDRRFCSVSSGGLALHSEINWDVKQPRGRSPSNPLCPHNGVSKVKVKAVFPAVRVHTVLAQRSVERPSMPRPLISWCGLCTLCTVLPQCAPTQSEEIHWGRYRLGDYFYNNPHYTRSANKEHLRGTIIEEYRSLATSVMDLKALVTACEDVCKKIAPPAPRLPRENYAAVHLRMGDVLGKKHYELSKYVPAALYEVAAADLVAAGVTAVDLFYITSWGVGHHAEKRIKRMTDTYLKTVTTVFNDANLTVQKAPSRNADQDVCAMLAAPIYLNAGGGYSRLIRQVRAQMGDTRSPDSWWWCEWPWARFVNNTALPYSQPVKDLYSTAVEKCGPYKRWRGEVEYWQALSKGQAGANPYNWTDIEEHLDPTAFDPTQRSNCFREGLRPPVNSRGVEVHGQPPNWTPGWNASVCCKFASVNKLMPVAVPEEVCATCVNHDHYCSHNRWRCETHCKMQFCESGPGPVHEKNDFPNLQKMIMQSRQTDTTLKGDETCQNWCFSRKSVWAVKCVWETCVGCSECQ